MSCMGKLPTLSPREVMISAKSHEAELGMWIGVFGSSCLPRSIRVQSANTRDFIKAGRGLKVVDCAQSRCRVGVGVGL